MNLQDVVAQLRKGKDLEKVLEETDWKNFEQLVAAILEQHGYKTVLNYRFKHKRRYEIDVIAIGSRRAILIDCKKWSGGRYKKSALLKAIEKQEERAKELFSVCPLFLQNVKEWLTLIVTLMEEDINKYSDTYVVPVWRLNSFLLSLDEVI